MSVYRTLLLSGETNSLLKIQNPLYKSLTLSSLFTGALNSSPQIDPESRIENGDDKKSLSVLFQQAVGLSERTDTSGSESEEQSENRELKRKLKELEREIRGLKAKSKDGSREGRQKDRVESKESEQARRLCELFGPKKQDQGMKLRLNVQEPRVKKEVYMNLSPYAENFVRHLYDQGYFNKATFLRDEKLDFGYFDSDYGRDYIYHAADKFGRDHQEIAKWLSGRNLKEVALLGCPSLAKKSVFAAKRLRKFFKIEEQTVCRKCPLKDSCKHANKDVWGSGIMTLSLSDVMRVILLYALDKASPQLTVPDKIKDSVAHLLKEAVKLSRTTSL